MKQLWTKSFPYRFDAVTKTNDGDFSLLRYNKPLSTIYSIITKVDTSINTLWEQSYPLIASNSLCETKDGNFIITNKDFGKVNINGITLWNRRFFGLNNINPPYNIYNVISTNDGGFLLTGYYDGDTFLIKTDCNGNTEWDTGSCLLPTEEIVLIFPNPFNEFITFQIQNVNLDTDKVQLKITNILGQVLFNEEYLNQNIFTLNTTQLSQGVYLYSIIINNTVYKSGKIVKQ